MEIAVGVHSLGQRQGGHVHAFLLDDGTGDLTLIDTLYDADAGPILRHLEEMNRPVTDLKHIVLTHAHRSHLGGLTALKQLSGATVYAHEWESDIIAGEREAQRVSFVPGRPILPNLRVYYLQAGLALGLGKHPPCAVDESLAEGDRVGPLHTFHMPGHSPGHMAFYWPERQTLFTGDTIATWPTFSSGWPAFNLNPTQLQRSLRRMADVEPEAVAVGHGEPLTTRARERVRDLVDRQRG
jgi:glyoxylase-like metal-dependent hydrolase (beta-lactamase superfamily II)